MYDASLAVNLEEVQAEYGLLSSDSEVDLVKQVNSYLASGWDLQGGVGLAAYVFQGFPRFRYTQAIVHYGTAVPMDQDQQSEQAEA